jgi:capsular polysaccharide biosynthesis protein
MFENFGFKDIFSELWKHRIIIGVLLVLAVIFGGMLGFRNSFNVIDHTQQAQKFVSSASYYVAVSSENATGSEVFYDRSKDVAVSFVSVLNSEANLARVLDTAQQQYGETALLYKLDSAVDVSDFDLKKFAEILQIKQLDNSNVIYISATTNDKSVSDFLVNTCREYLENELQPKIYENSLMYLGESSFDSAAASVQSQNNAGFSKRYAAVCFILMAFVCVFAAFLKQAFAPTLNRKCDLAHYGIPVIGEISVNSKGGIRK